MRASPRWIRSDVDRRSPRCELDDDGEAIGVRVVDARQAGEAFAGRRLVDVELVRCDLSGCDFSEAPGERVRLVDCRASAIELPQAKLRDVIVRRLPARRREPPARPAADRALRGSLLAGAEFIGGASSRT